MKVGGSLGIISVRETQIRGAICSSSYENIGRSELLALFHFEWEKGYFDKNTLRKSDLALTPRVVRSIFKRKASLLLLTEINLFLQASPQLILCMW